MIKASQNLFVSQKTRFILSYYKYTTLDIYMFFETTLDNTSMTLIFPPGSSATNRWMIWIGVALGASLLIGLATIALVHVVRRGSLLRCARSLHGLAVLIGE